MWPIQIEPIQRRGFEPRRTISISIQQTNDLALLPIHLPNTKESSSVSSISPKRRYKALRIDPRKVIHSRKPVQSLIQIDCPFFAVFFVLPPPQVEVYLLPQLDSIQRQMLPSSLNKQIKLQLPLIKELFSTFQFQVEMMYQLFDQLRNQPLWSSLVLTPYSFFFFAQGYTALTFLLVRRATRPKLLDKLKQGVSSSQLPLLDGLSRK